MNGESVNENVYREHLEQIAQRMAKQLDGVPVSTQNLVDMFYPWLAAAMQYGMDLMEDQCTQKNL